MGHIDPKRATADSVIAEIAERQHGVVSMRQLRAAGLSIQAVKVRLRGGRLHRVHQGVYAVGHLAVPYEGRCMAAVLALSASSPQQRREEAALVSERGPETKYDSRSGTGTFANGTETILQHWGAVVSHRSAATLWGLLPPTDGPIDISVPGKGGRRKRAGIRVHRCSTLLPAAVTSQQGIPVTTPARTIADLRRTTTGVRSRSAGPLHEHESRRPGRGIVSPKELRRAIRQAEVLGLSTGAEAATERTRSDLEGAFLRLCRRHGLPAPEVNARIGSVEVDFLWRDRRLIVETDGYRYHRGRAAFEDDRERDLELRSLGFEVIRLTYRQVVDEPHRIAAVLKPLLS